MKGIGVMVQKLRWGFSGYLCELLVMNLWLVYQNNRSLLSHNKRVIIDIENYYAKEKNDLSLIFPDP